MSKILIICIFFTVSIFGASFDCTKAKTNVEKMICSDSKLSALDENLSKVYSNFYFISKEIKSDQIAWMKKRNKCKDDACIKTAYTTRIQELNASLSNQKTFPKMYLEAMKEAENTMDITWSFPPINEKEQKRREESMKFKDEIFRFKNITFKLPLISGVSYDVPKLKEILGVCYYYRFDLEIREFDNPKYIEDGRKYWVEDERKPLRDINVSVWKTTAKDKEWLFIKPTNSGSAFLVDTTLCKQEKLKNNLVDALNYDRGRVKRSHFGLDNSSIVTYKNQEYVFELSLIQDYRYAFSILSILGITAADDPTIRFTGGWVYLIPFKKIDKSQTQQGKK